MGTRTAVVTANTSASATAQTVTYNDLATGLFDYHLTREVVGDGTAAASGTVTFRTTGSGAGALVSRIDDFHPAGFELVQARSSVLYLLGGQTWMTVSDDVSRDSAGTSDYYWRAGCTPAGDVMATWRVSAEPNPTGVVTGSLDGPGLRSVTSGSTALGDIGADPATFSADLINGLDLGQLIVGMAGS